MQDENRQILINIMGKMLKDKRLFKNVGILKFGGENSIPPTSLKRAEDGTCDLQITTLWKILEAHKIKPSEFFKLVEENLPKGWTLLDE